MALSEKTQSSPSASKVGLKMRKSPLMASCCLSAQQSDYIYNLAT